ncbi:MAG: hypothetical protein ACMZ7B_13850 [Balneola sp.]
MAHPNPLKTLFFFFFLVVGSASLTAQDNPYRFTFAPDLWYNDVDGIRIGIRTLGEVEGTFKDGPHRLDAGLWVGTWFPELPVSYYFSFTEPIKAISDFGNEGSIQLISSIRDGYSAHRLQFNKRWQAGFDELNHNELSVYVSKEKLIEPDYRQYADFWNTNWKTLLGATYTISKNPSLGRFFGILKVEQSLISDPGSFTTGSINLIQRINLNENFRFRLRGFFGYTNADNFSEYGFISSMESPQYWINRGIPRSKGSVPSPWFTNGLFQISGGPNLRGYLKRDIRELEAGGNPFYTSIGALNTEIEFPNPVNNWVKNISIVGDLTELRSYLFADLGIPFAEKEVGTTITNQISTLFADAGIGLQLSFNIPDYLGKDRGIFIRYDVPFWLSDPELGESNFSFRQLIGLGAIISF